MKTILISFSSYCKQHLWGTLTQKWCEITLLLRWKVLPFSAQKKDFISEEEQADLTAHSPWMSIHPYRGDRNVTLDGSKGPGHLSEPNMP